ncbi:mechanosensitive ion channel family protein [Palleronia sediminis]|uniref:Mechanosensitive ion channel family protein n=1 Tax=Palleronia sediminis TaxID=2547833 RepID=A0A4R6ANB9_9RHOB|nr:DUF3772 domain-containing protein [Palleronia sediminis]TDL84068.1 mechanosensitive ion channel family protein [Palleronia sediminis]
MIRRTGQALRRGLAALILLYAAGIAAAQTVEPPDYDAWNRLAEEVQQALENGAEAERLERLRARIAESRNAFLAAQSQNAARIETVRAQIAALGPPPEEGAQPEPIPIAQRRMELNAQLEELRAPVVAAEEVYTEADGLVAQIDRTIRERYASQLLAREGFPFNPAYWVGAVDVVIGGADALASEIAVRWDNPRVRRRAIDRLPVAAPLAVIAIFLILRSRLWVWMIESWAVDNSARWRGVLGFVLSLGKVVLPLTGLWLIAVALELTNFAGPKLALFVDNLWIVGAPPLVAHWLAWLLLPYDPTRRGPLNVAPDRRQPFRRYTKAVGFATGVIILVELLAAMTDRSDIAVSVLLWLPRMALAFFLFRLGRLVQELQRPVEEAEEGVDTTLGGSFTRGLGRLVCIAAIAGAALGTAGYANATDALLVPTVETLALIALVLLLQRFVSDLYAVATGRPEGSADALAPVLIGFALTLAALPVLALVWGARVSALTEMWSRFQAGFSIGDTRILPSDFLTFLLVFAALFALTRFIQATLRGTILPRTRIDIGGRNAIVSGLGYVGVFVAALAAISAAGIDLSSLAIVAGALSVGIGFGLQNVVSNFVSGIILLIERPISEGDWIEVNGQMGYVRDISVRSTRIETFDRTDVIVPNADLISGTVTNWTRGNLVGRVIVKVRVALGTDTREVERILLGIARAHPMVVLNPEPWIYFSGFSDNAMTFEIRAILRDVNWVLNVQSDMNHEIVRAFAEAGIAIPVPQRDVRLIDQTAPGVPH